MTVPASLSRHVLRAVLAILLALLARPLTAQPLPGLVVRGTVAGARALWDDTGTLFTYVSVDVQDVLVGDAVPRRLVLKQLGGQLGEIGLWIADQATFAIDEPVLLDLEISPRDGSLHTRDLARGKRTLDAAAPPDALSAALAAARTAAPAFVAVPPEFARAGDRDGAAFAYLPTGGAPPRWHQVDDGGLVHVDHPSALPGGWPGATSDVGDAITLWRSTGMELDLRDGGATIGAGQCPSSFTGNGRIAIAYNDPCGIADWVAGGGYYTTADLRTVNGVTFQKFVQGFVVLNETGPHTTSAGCFQDALSHGLGHALGLGHSSAGAIMQAGPPASCPANGNTPNSDDAQGITSIYEGIPVAVAPPDPPTAITASAVLSTVNIAWTPATTGGGAVQRYVIDAGTAPGVYNLGGLVVNAPATTTAAGNVPAGTYYLRVRAQNPLGTSGPSPETSVTVGACVPPGPPASLTVSANDTNVLLQWTPPASGVVQGYLVAAGSAPGLANLASIAVPATPTAFSAAAPYGQYYVRVHATNVCGVGAPSSEMLLSVTPCTAAPVAPTALASTVAGGVVTLQWTAPAAGAAPTGYTIRAGSAPGLSNLLVFPTGTTATTYVSPAPPGTYYVRVVATNACGVSAESNPIVVVVP